MSASNSLSDFEDIYTFSSDITAILDVSYSSGLVAVATEDGKLRLVDTSGSDGVVDTMTPVSSSIYITTLDNDPMLQIGNKFYAGFSDGSIIDFEIDSDEDWENHELVKGEREITSGGSINAISVMSLMSLAPDISDLIYSDGSMAHGLQSSDYSILWSGNGGRSSSITDLADSQSCYAYIAHEEGSVSEIGTCDFDSSNLYNNTALHDFTSSYSGSCGCSKVVGIDMHYRSFFATAGSSLYIIYREPADGGEENEEGPGGDVSVGGYILQLPNHSWKDGVLCKVELLCFAKMVTSADNNDRLTYIDQDITLSILNTDGTEIIEAVISDEDGNIVKREPMICTAYGGSSGCTAEITVQTSDVKSQLFETTMNTLHDGMEQYFESQAEGSVTDLFVKIAIPVICTVVGVVAGFVSAGTAAIPAGVGCVHALWALYGIVKSVSFLLSLVTYYNIVDDNLGIYENKVFPNHYLSAIEVDGVVHDIQDQKLDRLNDVSQFKLESFGEQDKLEFFGFSPVDFKLYRDGQTINDDEDLFQITGNSPLEALLIIDPDDDDTIRVEGTGSGVYSLVGIYNDADISSNSEDEEAPFATAFLIEKDTQISNGETVTYLDYDYLSWDDEAKLQDDGGVNSDDVGAKDPERKSVWNVLAPLLLLSGIIAAAVVVIIRKRREKSTPTNTPPFVTEQQALIVPNQPQIPQPLHAHEVISPSPQQNQFVAPAPVYDPIPSVEQQWVDNQGRTWRRLNNWCTQMWNGTDWQNI
jgi:hypothetical protein